MDLEAEALKRLHNPEDNFTERKSQGMKDSEIRRTVVAFANSAPHGVMAFLFIGIDDGGTLAGVDNPDQLQKHVRAALDDCFPPIAFRSIVVREDGKAIVVVAVEASENRPHFAGPAYVREGSQSVKSNERVFAELIASRAGPFRALREVKGKLVTLYAWADYGLGKLTRAQWGMRPGYFNWYAHEVRIEELDEHTVTFYPISTMTRWAVSLDAIRITRDIEKDRLALAIESSG